MLIEPVTHVGAADPVPPPGLGLVFLAPGGRGIPVVVDVMIVEDHRGRDDRQQPSHRGLAPGFSVEEAVLGEVRDLVTRRARWVAALADELAHRRPDLIRVNLVADHKHDIRPARGRHFPQVLGVGGQRVSPMLLLVPGAWSATCRHGQLSDPAGTEDQPKWPLRVQRPEQARREPRTRLGPADDAIQGHLVLVPGSGPEAADHDQPVVMPCYLEGPHLMTEDFDPAGPVGLHPYGGRSLADVAEQRPEHEHGRSPVTIPHAALLPRISHYPHPLVAHRPGDRGAFS